MAIVLNLTIGLITPPVGGVLFVITSVSRLKFEGISKAIIPMIVAEFRVLLADHFVPAVTTYPSGPFGLFPLNSPTRRKSSCS